MATTKIRGNTQIIAGTITNAEINASASIATSKLADSGNFILKGGSVAFTADQSLGGNKITNLGTPTSSGDASTKAYVDSAVSAAVVGQSKRARVRAATTGNITISTALNNGDTLDGVTLVTDDLVLVKNQTASENNGVYVVGASPARNEQFDTYNEHPGSVIGVEEGTTNGDTIWFCTSNDGGTLNTTAIEFTKLVVTGELLAANNLSEVANAATAFSNIKQAATTSATGVVELATDGENASGVVVQGNDSRLSNSRTPTSHATSHKSGGSDSIKLDELAAPTDVTTLNATTSAHGLLPKLAGGTSTFLRADGSWAAPTGSGDMLLADYIVRETPSPAVDGSTTVFTFAHSFTKEMVFLNGVLQEPSGEDYTVTGGNEITFVSAPASTDRLRVTYYVN
ncbi:MAG: hypothetical protein EBU46_00360 [Nitrosomonadaceae bacterium]|nr:hypothetical protein [Nitrosomonadaceae bacterium]